MAQAYIDLAEAKVHRTAHLGDAYWRELDDRLYREAKERRMLQAKERKTRTATNCELCARKETCCLRGISENCKRYYTK